MSFLELQNINKTFNGFKANSNINLKVEAGEIHAILGENGAGKSTLMKMIFGLYTPDSGGKIFFKDKELKNHSPSIATKLGIGMVHQHFMLINPLTVLENIILGLEPKKWFFFIDKESARKKIQKIIDTYHFNLDLDSRIDQISVGMGQRVEIIKTLYRNAELIILDEPTAVLTPQEIEDFYQIVMNLKNEGKTIIIITHKLHEIKRLADRCSIIRKGEYITTVNVNQTSEEELANLMVGRNINLNFKLEEKTHGSTLFELQSVSSLNHKNILALNKFSLNLKKGEIYGIAGVDGNGQNELVEGIIGLRKFFEGSMSINGKNVTNLSPREIYAEKISIIPADRKKWGLVLDYTIEENLFLRNIDENPFSEKGLLNFKAINKRANELIERFDIRPTDPKTVVKGLSGGNQQKVIIAREVMNEPDLLVMFQPTRGLDVGAIEYVYEELKKLREQNKTILLISYDLDEILKLSDRIGIIFEGKIIKEYSRKEINVFKNIKEKIGLNMAGSLQ